MRRKVIPAVALGAHLLLKEVSRGRVGHPRLRLTAIFHRFRLRLKVISMTGIPIRENLYFTCESGSGWNAVKCEIGRRRSGVLSANAGGNEPDDEVPKPPSQAVYETFKNAPLDFKLSDSFPRLCGENKRR
jgi:hypothetical protein